MQEKLFEWIEQYLIITDAEKKALVDLDIFRSYPKGTVLLNQGERSRNEYFVLQGLLRRYFEKDGEEKTVEFYAEGEGVTPICTVNGEPSDYSIATLEECTLIVSNSSMGAILYERFPRFETLCRLVSDDLILKTQVIFDNFKSSTPEERYIHLLDKRPDLIQRVPQYQLASFLGITPESLSRIRKRLTKYHE